MPGHPRAFFLALNLVIATSVGDCLAETVSNRHDDTEQSASPLQPPPESAEGAVSPPRAAETSTAWTIGPKKVLVLRIDFSDVPGEPTSVEEAQDAMDNYVRPFFENSSYAKTTLVTTVSHKVYRMPQTAASYAIDDARDRLRDDAHAAAAADYDVKGYDRIVVDFADIGPSKIPGSQFRFSGLGGGADVWVSDRFRWTILAHELGHTYGLAHAEIWTVEDGNPVSGRGVPDDGNDPFDRMGTGGELGEFGPRARNFLGWMPDSAVTDVSRSGVYRVYRFDSRSANLTQPLALRVYRGDGRWYWIGYRHLFATDRNTEGAYIVWGYAGTSKTHLIDVNTPGINPKDAILQIGATFSDVAFGISIKPLARGGAEPDQYLDIAITVAPLPQTHHLVSWGSGSAAGTNAPIGLAGVKSIAAVQGHGIVLKEDGTVFAWGANAQGESNVPAGLANVAAVAAGTRVSGALKQDGTVLLWGDARFGQTKPPSGLTNVRQLAIGNDHVLALKTDGTVVAWGANGYGQTNVPINLGVVVAVAAGDQHSVALRSDGTVARWGASYAGPTLPTGLREVVALSSSAYHTLALKKDGTVTAWGLNGNGQCNVLPGLTGVVAISAGRNHSLALKHDGTVVGWGSTDSGQLAIPPGLPRCFAIAASGGRSFALVGPRIFLSTAPQSQTFPAGTTLTLTTPPFETGLLTYRWSKDGAVLPGATSDSLTIAGMQTSDGGIYSVTVSNALGSATRAAATLTVLPAASISNLSVRTRAGTGDRTLIVGFVIAGSGSRRMLLRSIGPTLGQFGVADSLVDPQLQLFDSSHAAIGMNDDWGGGSALAAAFSAVGAFALPVGSRDAAISIAVPAGPYSAVVSSTAGSGVALVEVYDMESQSTTARVVNLAARTQVGTGAEILIAGFAIGGSGTRTILIRAVGPTLSAFGVNGTLVDPKLELYAGTMKIDENDNWSGASTLANAFDAVGAFNFYSPTSRDAALLAALGPGNYTAQVSGVNDATGVALVEIYALP